MATITAAKKLLHTACRSTDPNNLVAYQVGKNEKPVFVSLIFKI